MRYISIEQAKSGMRLARSIVDPNNHVLLSVDCELTWEHIHKLEDRGYAGFYIEDALSKDIMIEESISAETKSLALRALRSQNIDASLRVAQEIAEQLRNSKTISLDLLDLRSFDDYTYKHSVNVCVLATVVGIGLKLPEKELVQLSAAALLHDIGKLQIDPEILNKPSRLTAEEYRQVQRHPELSFALLSEKPQISAMIKQGVLYHHENEDGSGYPEGLDHDRIPLFSKIIHCVDVYDALTSRRPYKKPYAIADAIEYLMGGSSILFDDNIVAVFLKSVPVYPRGTSVMMSDGREALVVANTSNPMRPKIRFLDGTTVDLNEDTEKRNLTIAPTTEIELDFSDNRLQCSSTENTESDASIQDKTILVVDDVVSTLKNVSAILGKQYHLELVKSGEQALQYLRKNPMPDLVIMDIDMPTMNGIETVRRIRRYISKTLPIIFLTAITERQIVLQCRALDVADYIVKPCNPVYMQERVKVALGEKDRRF